jgi:hypothetical protein
MMQPSTILKKVKPKMTLLFGLLALLMTTPPALAQDYFFGVPELQMQVFVQSDASARIVYDITIANEPGAHPIDIVDIGTPHEDYDIGNMSASVDGVPLNVIRPSEFVDPGVEVHLGDHTIPAGQSGTLHFEFTMPDMVFQDVTNRDNASLQITPTWFGSEFVTGSTNLQIAIHLPEGIQPEEVLYQREPFTNKAIFQGRTVAVWEFPNIQLTGPNQVGVSFPKRGMTRVVSMNVLQLAVRWFANNPNARIVAGVVAAILFSFLFFRFSGGTGFSVWVIGLGGLIFLFINSPGLHLLSFPALLTLIFFNEGRRQRRKGKYLPAIAQVEGGGIKRGLTAPEAAALIELPLHKVLTLIIFGLLKKGVLRQVKDSPLTVEVVDEFRATGTGKSKGDRTAQRRQTAQEKGIVLHQYEQKFLDVLEEKSTTPVHRVDLSRPMEAFIRYTAGRIKGFDLSDTQDYYRQIVSRAVTEARTMGDIPELEQQLDRDMEWILMADEEEYRPVFARPGYPYQPIWVRPGPIFTGGSSTPAPRSSSGGTTPSFSDVAAGFAGWAEGTMGSMASMVMPGSIQTGGGAVDLSGFDRVTGDIFEALTKSSGGSGGSSGGGGCACAGCACACACAGGGR